MPSPSWASRIDRAAALRSWQESLAAPVWDGAAVWVHGDLLPGNLLVVDGRLSAVIDFGVLTVGDPACDLLPAWNLFADRAGTPSSADSGPTTPCACAAAAGRSPRR